MITLVFGTRPEAIKLGPIANELRNLRVPFRIIQSGQHTHLLRGTPAELDLQPDIIINSWNAEGVDRASEIAKHLDKSDLIVVQGDTETAVSATFAGSRTGCRIAHVEAGVRSWDIENPKPEEGYRQYISQLACYHFAPTTHCVANLERDGIEKNVYLTGNPVVSALHRYAKAHPDAPTNHILMTMHRREFINRGGEHIDAFWHAVQRWTDHELGIRIIWPIHPSLRDMVASKTVYRNFWPTAPQTYDTIQKTLRNALGVITDSGGLTEEATALGIPVAVLRVVNDRPEAEVAGYAKRFDPTAEGFEAAAEWIRTNKHQPRIPTLTFGSVHSAHRIANRLRSVSRETKVVLPT